jgi:hypothetical protein
MVLGACGSGYWLKQAIEECSYSSAFLENRMRIKARPSRIPLICKMSVIANVVPMWVTNLKTIIRINYRNSTIWPKHCFQLYGMLLSAWPVENERLNFHG